jgi:hypothetical protein
MSILSPHTPCFKNNLLPLDGNPIPSCLNGFGANTEKALAQARWMGHDGGEPCHFYPLKIPEGIPFGNMRLEIIYNLYVIIF